MREIDQNGGLVPKTKKERDRAEDVDLITLPTGIPGTNCANCKFSTSKLNAPDKVRDEIPEGGLWCTHKEVKQPVNNRNCCSLWDQEGTLRHFD